MNDGTKMLSDVFLCSVCFLLSAMVVSVCRSGCNVLCNSGEAHNLLLFLESNAIVDTILYVTDVSRHEIFNTKSATKHHPFLDPAKVIVHNKSSTIRQNIDIKHKITVSSYSGIERCW